MTMLQFIASTDKLQFFRVTLDLSFDHHTSNTVQLYNHAIITLGLYSTLDILLTCDCC